MLLSSAFFAQGDGGIDAGRADGGQPAGEKHGDDGHDDRSRVDVGVARVHAVEQAVEVADHGERRGQPGHDSEDGEPRSLEENQFAQSGGIGPESRTDAELARALGDPIGDDAEELR